jgi:hypothetical protein
VGCGKGKGTWRPAREERETGAFFLSLSALLAAVVFAARRPLPPLPAIAAGTLGVSVVGRLVLRAGDGLLLRLESGFPVQSVRGRPLNENLQFRSFESGGRHARDGALLVFAAVFGVKFSARGERVVSWAGL